MVRALWFVMKMRSYILANSSTQWPIEMKAVVVFSVLYNKNTWDLSFIKSSEWQAYLTDDPSLQQPKQMKCWRRPSTLPPKVLHILHKSRAIRLFIFILEFMYILVHCITLLSDIHNSCSLIFAKHLFCEYNCMQALLSEKRIMIWNHKN